MNLRTLQYLVALAETRHFGRAAQQCHVSQPTLSAQIKKLEFELGVELVERQHKNVMLTPVGERIVARARSIHGLVDEIRGLARYHQNPFAGQLSLGFIPTLGPYLLPHIVGPLADALPDLAFFFAEHQTADLIPRLAAGELDVVFLALPHGQVESVPLERRPLFNERFVVAMPASHVLADAAHINAGEVAQHDLLLLQEGHCLRDQALDVCGIGGSAGDDPRRQTLAATSLETLRQMVAAGQGITLLPELSITSDAHLGRSVIRPFTAPAPTRTIAALWRASSVRTASITRVCDVVVHTMQATLDAA
ncbi:MAG: LysR substrate-binding domain-containing protein [Pseudomonadota bacterium]